MSENEFIDNLLDNPEFIERMAMRVAHVISTGANKNSASDAVQAVGDQYFTVHQLERFKKAFVFLLSRDEEFKRVVRNTFVKYVGKPVKNPLTRNELLRRIQEYGTFAFLYRGKLCGFFCSDIYAVFHEYSPRQIKTMLVETKLLVKIGTRKNPHTRTVRRTFILDS